MKYDHIEVGFDTEPRANSAPLITQVHGTNFVEVKDTNHARRLTNHPPEADALITHCSGISIPVFTADCLPVLLYTTDKQGPIAAIHSGWRGAQQGIVRHVLRSQSAKTQHEWHAVIGPGILSCCYEVQLDLIDRFRNSLQPIDPYIEVRQSKRYFNLPKFVVETHLGDLDRTHIHLDNLRCTACSQPQLPSYRRDGKTDPRIRAWIRK